MSSDSEAQDENSTKSLTSPRPTKAPKPSWIKIRIGDQLLTIPKPASSEPSKASIPASKAKKEDPGPPNSNSTPSEAPPGPPKPSSIRIRIGDRFLMIPTSSESSTTPITSSEPPNKPKIKRRKPWHFGWSAKRRSKKAEDSKAPEVPEAKKEEPEVVEFGPKKKAEPLIRIRTEKGFATVAPPLKSPKIESTPTSSSEESDSESVVKPKVPERRVTTARKSTSGIQWRRTSEALPTSSTSSEASEIKKSISEALKATSTASRASESEKSVSKDSEASSEATEPIKTTHIAPRAKISSSKASGIKNATPEASEVVKKGAEAPRETSTTSRQLESRKPTPEASEAGKTNLKAPRALTTPSECSEPQKSTLEAPETLKKTPKAPTARSASSKGSRSKKLTPKANLAQGEAPRAISTPSKAPESQKSTPTILKVKEEPLDTYFAYNQEESSAFPKSSQLLLWNSMFVPEIIDDDESEYAHLLHITSSWVLDSQPSEPKKKPQPLTRIRTEKGFVTVAPREGAQKRRSSGLEGVGSKKLKTEGDFEAVEKTNLNLKASESLGSAVTSSEAAEVSAEASKAKKSSPDPQEAPASNPMSSEAVKKTKLNLKTPESSGSAVTSSKAVTKAKMAPKAPEVPGSSPTSSEAPEVALKTPESRKSSPESLKPPAPKSNLTSSKAVNEAKMTQNARETPKPDPTSSEAPEKAKLAPKCPEAPESSSTSSAPRKSAPLIRIRTEKGLVTLPLADKAEVPPPPFKNQKRRSGSMNSTTDPKKKKVGGAKDSGSLMEWEASESTAEIPVKVEIASGESEPKNLTSSEAPQKNPEPIVTSSGATNMEWEITGSVGSPEWVSMDSDEGEAVGTPFRRDSGGATSSGVDFAASGAPRDSGADSRALKIVTSSNFTTIKSETHPTSTIKDSEIPKSSNSTPRVPKDPKASSTSTFSGPSKIVTTSNTKDSEAPGAPTPSTMIPEAPKNPEAPDLPTSSKPDSEDDLDITEPWMDQKKALESIRQAANPTLNTYSKLAFDYVARLQIPPDSEERLKSIKAAIRESKACRIFDSQRILESEKAMNPGDIIAEVIGHVEMAGEVRKGSNFGFKYSGFRRELWITPINETRAVRRSRKPNATLSHAISENGGIRLLLVATSSIKKLEEVTLPLESSEES